MNWIFRVKSVKSPVKNTSRSGLQVQSYAVLKPTDSKKKKKKSGVYCVIRKPKVIVYLQFYDVFDHSYFPPLMCALTYFLFFVFHTHASFGGRKTLILVYCKDPCYSFLLLIFTKWQTSVTEAMRVDSTVIHLICSLLQAFSLLCHIR